MKNFSNFTSPLSLQSIEAKALKAAKASAVSKILSKSPATPAVPRARRKPKAEKKLSEMERDVRSIIDVIKRSAGNGRSVTVEYPHKKGSAHLSVSIENLNDQKEEIRYVFYPSAIDSTRLGSVAIYCKDAAERQIVLSKMGTFFGFRILRAKLELGRRPFVDVTLRS